MLGLSDREACPRRAHALSSGSLSTISIGPINDIVPTEVVRRGLVARDKGLPDDFDRGRTIRLQSVMLPTCLLTCLPTSELPTHIPRTASRGGAYSPPSIVSNLSIKHLATLTSSQMWQVVRAGVRWSCYQKVRKKTMERLHALLAAFDKIYVWRINAMARHNCPLNNLKGCVRTSLSILPTTGARYILPGQETTKSRSISSTFPSNPHYQDI